MPPRISSFSTRFQRRSLPLPTTSKAPCRNNIVGCEPSALQFLNQRHRLIKIAAQRVKRGKHLFLCWHVSFHFGLRSTLLTVA